MSFLSKKAPLLVLAILIISLLTTIFTNYEWLVATVNIIGILLILLMFWTKKKHPNTSNK